jgi:hypothetical protein
MSHWKAKSESNFNATNKLNLEDFFAPSVHCSYYSCIQLMLHILSSHFNKTDKEINDESYEGSKLEHGMHNWLINKITGEFGSFIDANLFGTEITDLQTLRVKSDYKNKHINETQARDARNQAYKTLGLLKRNFRT